MKYILKSVILTFLFFTATTGTYGQPVHISYSGAEITVSKDTLAQLTLFTGKYFEGKTYLHWNIANQHADGLYLIYRSVNDKEYEMIGQKQGIGVPISAPMAYYFIDEHPLEGVTFYKLIHFSMNNGFMISKTIKIVVEPEKYLSVM